MELTGCYNNACHLNRLCRIRLPKEFQFSGKDVLIQKVGDAVILIPHDKSWEVFLHGLNSFTEDFMAEGRDQGKNQEIEDL